MCSLYVDGKENGGDSLKHGSPKPSRKVKNFHSHRESGSNNNYKKSSKAPNKSRKQIITSKHAIGDSSPPKIRRILSKESKPWKMLKDVEEDSKREAMLPIAAEVVTKVEEDNIVPQDEIERMLNPVTTEPSVINAARSIWQDGEDGESQGCGAVSNLWQFDSDSTELIEAISVVRDGEDESSDFDMIEQSLASIKFCENIPTGCKDSKSMQFYEDNPFSYLIQHTSVSSAQTNIDPQPVSYTCKHCHESYEIVLDVESEKMSKSQPSTGILSLTDSRLNFDWCKYHPPPWLYPDFQAQDKTDNQLEKKTGCDCEFCRHQIWNSTCQWCATPL